MSCHALQTHVIDLLLLGTHFIIYGYGSVDVVTLSMLLSAECAMCGNNKAVLSGQKAMQ